MNVFYCPDAMLNELCVLDETESKHIVSVLRKREGEELFVFDGKGNLFDARIISVGKKEVTVRVAKLLEADAGNKSSLHIAIAPPKNIERFEWFIEKATEIGISQITPLLCTRSERRELRIDRLQRVMLSACKQSLKYQIPVLNEMIKYDELLRSFNGESRKFIAHLDEKSLHFKQAYHGGFDVVMLIGPEGDFTPEEIALAVQREFEPVILGKSRLRLETAGVYAAAAFNMANE
ncbi:MAG: 16S rRNA (uracil(1498)-N(3))-methyltransferase [Bacteroidetes bacterium]|nr:16S rRNA (uracil(1498)-N(3))-methyltransferase [Bacteroidota bacterium]